MSPSQDPKDAATADEFDATDSGWDPYVTSLLTGANGNGDSIAGDEEDATPVMSFTPRRKTPSGS